jgi:hypothetical protein
MKSFIRAAIAASLAIAAAIAVRAPPALAHTVVGGQTYTFTACSHNSSVDVAIGQTQMSVTVFDAGGGHVGFDFHNTGAFASSITDVYFQDGPLFGIASITNDPGNTSFLNPATPADLPSGNTCVPPFHVTDEFSADSDPQHGGVAANGVNPGEYVVINFTLLPGKTLADVIAALNSGALRVGIHVQAFANGQSESFVNTTPTAVNLSALGATAVRGQVTLAWRTGSESSNAGFNVYRATSASGARTKVNERLIAAQGSEASGASYSIVDRPGYGSFYYWLEGVDYTGQTSLHGPVRVNVRAAVQRPLYRPTLPGTRR